MRKSTNTALLFFDVLYHFGKKNVHCPCYFWKLVWSKHPVLPLRVQFYNYPNWHLVLLEIKHTYLYIMNWTQHTLTNRHATISWKPALIEKGLGIATKVQRLIVSWWEMIVRWVEGECKDKSWSMRRALIGPSYGHQVILRNDVFPGLLNGRWRGCVGHIQFCSDRLCCTPWHDQGIFIVWLHNF